MSGWSTVAARCRNTASPDFMSEVPQPCSSLAVEAAGQIVGGRDGVDVTGQQHPRWPAPGSCGPARRCRCGRPRSRRSGRAARLRSRRRCAARDAIRWECPPAPRSAAIGSPCRSRPTRLEVSRVRFWHRDFCFRRRPGDHRGRRIGTRHLVSATRTRRRRSDGHRAAVGRGGARRAGALTGRDEDRDIETVVVRTTIASLEDKATDAYDAYLRLHLLSHRLVAPARAQRRRLLRPADQRGVDQPRAVRGGGLRGGAGPAAPPRTGDRLRHRQVPADGRLRGARPACASPTPTGCGWVRTWRRARPSCTRAS